MSSAIKPPGPGGPAGVAPEGGDAPTEGVDAERRIAGKDFRAELDKASGAQGDPAVARQEASSRADLLKSIAEDIRSGHLDPQGAIDRLVERALSSAHGLSPTARAELEALLRSTLENDPTLAAMQKDLARGR